MGRGGKVGARRNCKRRARLRDNGSDDSDEDYMVEEEEEVEVSEGLDEYRSDASEESYDSFKEEEDWEEDEGEVRPIVRSEARLKSQGGSLGQKKIGVERSQRRERVSYEEEDMDDDCCDDDEDDDDVEFAPDEIDSVDEEEELLVDNKNKNNSKKVGGRAIRKKCPTRGKRRKKNFRGLKRMKGRSSGGSRRKARCNNDDGSVERNAISRVESKKKSGEKRRRRRRRYTARSDSDFVSSESSDCEYTISGEERDLVREASKFCRSLKRLRSSSSLSRIQDDRVVSQQRNSIGRKGKEKIEDPKNEVVKQICGICLSEEGKRTVRGMLNCCSHYFCFACIMEWSKVESRCPLCKQRFVTISKPARPNAGIDLRNVVIQVPERDQLYQPSEEEIRIFLDPYEHVICTECQEGGDDGLMLLCDLCDSPAHTYCVGLGREVPEGNWYCEGCRPVAVGYVQAQHTLPEHRTASNSLSNRRPHVEIIRESLDFDSSSFSHTPFTQGFGTPTPSAYTVGDVQAASPLSGGGPSTLSGRRWIHRQIHHLLSSHIMARMAGRSDGSLVANSTIDPVDSHGHDEREPTFQCERIPEIGTPRDTFIGETVPNSPSPLLSNRDPFSGRLGLFRRQMFPDSTTTATDVSIHRTSWDNYAEVSLISDSQRLHQCSSRSSMGFDSDLSSRPVRE